MENEEFKGVVLIIGASRGIGKAIAQRCTDDGFFVILNYNKSQDEAQNLLQELNKKKFCAELCPFDLRDSKAVSQALDQLTSKYHFFGLVMNAGIRDDELLVFMDESKWDRILDTNLYSFYRIVKPIVTQMIPERKGRIVVISSTSGQSGHIGQVHYAASKAGLIGAVKSLALECAKKNILVNAVAPGFIESDMTQNLDHKVISNQIPMKRFGTPQEVASVVSFLLSKDSSYITGQVISVNGGIYL